MGDRRRAEWDVGSWKVGEDGADEMALACHSHGQAGVLKSPLSCGLLFSLCHLFSKCSPVTWVALTGHLDDCGRSCVWMYQPFPRGSFKPVKHSTGQQMRSLPTLRFEFEKLSFGNVARTVQPSPQPHGCLAFLHLRCQSVALRASPCLSAFSVSLALLDPLRAACRRDDTSHQNPAACVPSGQGCSL